MTQKKGDRFDYLKYSGLAFQMFLTLIAGWWIGSWIDAYFKLETPIFSLLLIFLFLFGFLFKLVRDLSDSSK